MQTVKEMVYKEALYFLHALQYLEGNVIHNTLNIGTLLQVSRQCFIYSVCHFSELFQQEPSHLAIILFLELLPKSVT